MWSDRAQFGFAETETVMITAVVTFKIPQGTTRAQWLEHIKSISMRFQDVPVLIRKQFLYSDEGIAGGVYLWETREAAEALYAGAWRENLRKIADADPDIAWYDTQIAVDNESHEIRIAA
jgi:hypothetical protein